MSETGKIEFADAKRPHEANFMQIRNDGGLAGSLAQQYSTSTIYIPMTALDWKRLTRETQIKILDELGILGKKQ